MVAFSFTSVIAAVPIVSGQFISEGSASSSPTFPQPIGASPGPTGWAPCATCPDPVLSTLRTKIQGYYRNIQNIEAFTVFFENIGDLNITQELVTKVSNLVSQIPDPFLPDISEIYKYLTCPLTPFALAIDPTKLSALDPEALFRGVLNLYRDYAGEVFENFVNQLEQLAEWQVIRIFFGFIQAIKRMRFDTEQFVEGILIAGLVEATCAETYRDSVFASYTEIAASFNISNFTPVGLTGIEKQLASSLGEAAVKFAGWAIVSAGLDLV